MITIQIALIGWLGIVAVLTLVGTRGLLRLRREKAYLMKSGTTRVD